MLNPQWLLCLVWQITTHFARKGRDHIEHIDKAKCCKMEQCCGFTLRDRGIYSPNKPTWALGNEGPIWTKGKTKKVNKSLTTYCSSCVCVILALWVIVCLFVSKLWPGIARQATVRMYQQNVLFKFRMGRQDRGQPQNQLENNSL